MDHQFSRRLVALAFAALLFVKSVSHGQVSEMQVLRSGLAIQVPRGYTETIIAPNPIEERLALGTWKAPRQNETVMFADGTKREWQSITADTNGWFSGEPLRNSYVYLPVEMKQKTVMILEALGNDMVYINGSPRSGNPYANKETYEDWETRFDYSQLPILLEAGKNDLLFRCSRGRLKVKLFASKSLVMFNINDVTLPDFIVGDKVDTWGAVVVINATSAPLKDLMIRAAIEKSEGAAVEVPVIQPLSVRKIGFRLSAAAPSEKGTANITLSLFRKSRPSEVLSTATITARIVNRNENHKETFISQIDGSVQHYGINPASDAGQGKPMALFLSVHGAGVEAVNQSGSYYPKTWGYIVAPTNRRPYGFNWEDWGRQDAMEVLSIVKQRYNIDESRVYLTGHSMGGHGAWHLGAIFPDQFAAIGPSAGWISFWSYRFRGIDSLDVTPIRRMIRRATTPSETFAHVENYRQLGVYVLHGSDDDNVRVDQARMMVERLEQSHHRDFIYHEEKGAGHWWDNSDEPGAACVDWPPMFDFFARHARPEKDRIRTVNFLTANPGISAKNNWVTIDAQIKQLEMSSVEIRFDPGARRFAGTTKNVARLAFDLDIVKSPGTITVELDSQKLGDIPRSLEQKQLWLELKDGKWVLASEPPANVKGSHRYGTFKEAFRNRMLFVYGTKGTAEENRWAFDKARYDAEKFWYQGNGSIELIADVDFDPLADPDRSVILYGNQKTNAAWKALLSDSPVQVGVGFVQIGQRKFTGRNLSCLLVRPRAGSRTASVAAVSGTDIVGMRISNRLPYLNPGIGLPDCTVLTPAVLSRGEEGVIMTGFFGLDWSIENGEFLWGAEWKAEAGR
ncbi:MAG: prolyl oligopeptidase family serine peptidase [candidate division KSB1 bacterium]|nr:prolyl oligopeptidase family serine peptidase [candidate division KSB1 bacterium]MDZ7304740.1 prolyl oligopeptidase family serine peptidase [candidate division KSB1 bacterium]MDZ7313843.1 prolyl oligopeptidase family serine peptidase [candidate division KSB1 bacterium]